MLPFGFRNAPATFQRLIAFVTNDLVAMRCYQDDLVVWSETLEENVIRLHLLFQALVRAWLIVKLKKTECGNAHVNFLGYVVGQGHVAIIEAKIKVLLRYPVPENREALMRFIGMIANYKLSCVSSGGLFHSSHLISRLST